MPEAFEPFPEILAMGRDRVQQLCDEWCQGPQAKECGVAYVTVAPNGLSLMPTFEVYASNYAKGDELHFPHDRVVEFIIAHGCRPDEQDGLKNRLRMMRQKAGPRVFQRYKVSLEAYRMALKCPACSHGLLSQYRIFKGQEFDGTFEPITCPRCRHTFPVTARDFFPVLNPGQGEPC
jgi:hypothetical protein